MRRFVGANNPSVVDRTIAMDSVLTVWKGTGTHWGVGALIGAAVGAGVSISVGAIVLSKEDPGSCSVACWSVGIATGAVVGGLIGALVGHQYVWWELVPKAVVSDGG